MGMTHTPFNLKTSLLYSLAFCFGLWLIFAIAQYWQLPLFKAGVLPRQLVGLVGIISAPLAHGSWSHLVSNTAPLLILGSGLLLAYPQSRWRALTLIWLGSGVGVWLLARDSYHYGASGLTHGLFFYLFVIGLLRRDKRSTALLMIAFFLYGGMLASVFPTEPGISYESHLAGAICGVIGAIIWRKADPMPAEKVYSWELEDDEGEALGEDPYWEELRTEVEQPKLDDHETGRHPKD